MTMPRFCPPVPGYSRGRSCVIQQRGVALIVALILLLVITLVGLAAVGSTIMQNKMAANQYDREIAFQAAESALRVAEQKLIGLTPPIMLDANGIEDCSTRAPKIVAETICKADPFDDAGATNFIQGVVSGQGKGQFDPGVVAAGQPQYVIQYMGSFLARQKDNPAHYVPADYYRITARSGNPKSIGDRSIVTLQSIYLK